VAGCAVAARAQGLPTKPIILIVPYGVGGLTHVQARALALAAAASKELRQQIVQHQAGLTGKRGSAMRRTRRWDRQATALNRAQTQRAR
jgi:tripartite-type tricarboxylate transporter receptor subunit TctC